MRRSRSPRPLFAKRCAARPRLLLPTLALALASPLAHADPPEPQRSFLRTDYVALIAQRVTERAGFGVDRISPLVTRARLGGLVPRVTVRLVRGATVLEQLPAGAQDPTALRASSNDSLSFDVRAAFELDRLLFDSREPGLLQAEFSRQERRARLEHEVVDLLAELERARAELPASPEEAARVRFAARRARARLELLLGGALPTP